MPGGLPPRSSLWPSSPTPVTLCTHTVTREASGSCCTPCPCCCLRWPELAQPWLAVLPPPLLHPRPEAPAAATGARAMLAAPTPLGPLASPRFRLPATLHARPADLEAAAVVGGLRRAQRLRRRRGTLHDGLTWNLQIYMSWFLGNPHIIYATVRVIKWRCPKMTPYYTPNGSCRRAECFLELVQLHEAEEPRVLQCEGWRECVFLLRDLEFFCLLTKRSEVTPS
ncbi:uncharacterized protein LOC144577061 [Callithrix jacchus]